VCGVAATSSAGGRIGFSATVAPNAPVLLKCIPGQTTGLQKTYDAVARYCAGNWREHFNEFLKTVSNENVYVTLDLDCLDANEAVTNWEAGRFKIEDLEWALAKLGESSRIIGGDICGAYSPPSYARFKQRFAAEFDHPKIELPAIACSMVASI
jgi:hypothetical protein